MQGRNKNMLSSSDKLKLNAFRKNCKFTKSASVKNAEIIPRIRIFRHDCNRVREEKTIRLQPKNFECVFGNCSVAKVKKDN